MYEGKLFQFLREEKCFLLIRQISHFYSASRMYKILALSGRPNGHNFPPIFNGQVHYARSCTRHRDCTSKNFPGANAKQLRL
jgi:hypothetical protein